ncbi:hypothetical protein Mal15_67070 [Stieleria maiorica]|uniref:Uncharacterized protein n=1 Tax=Stieleria maiorica TaxID=2795974 RepID=A0A5B9MRY5_9BACT|nr:hypothetical protein [Stieleria maiorica]QEG02586.1 hypothetical protein Mal15_67070 [Stieleria maiorica]
MRFNFPKRLLLISSCLVVALLAAAPAAEESIRVRNDTLLEQVEQDWRYPETGYSGRGRTGSIRTLVQHAEASYDKVWQHYADRCGFDQRFDEGLFVLGREVDDTVYLVDDRRSRTDGKRTQTFFVCNAPNHSVTVILEPQSDDATGILMTITVR